MSRVFLSYNRRSQDAASALVRDLELLGHTVWFDRELSGGQAWWDQILLSIRDCDSFVFLLDQSTLDSTACQRECGYADALGKPILPVLVADGIAMNLLPPELARLQFVDYRKGDRNDAFGLARAFGTLPAGKPMPDPMPVPPEPPVSYLGGLARRVTSDSTLSYDEQSALVMDLKRGLRNEGGSEDALVLLRKMRIRRDLFAAMAEEIDGALQAMQETQSEDRGTASLASEAGRIEQGPIQPEPQSIPWKKPAMVGGICGAVVGLAYSTTDPHIATTDLPILAIVGAVPFAIFGAIFSRYRKRRS